MAHGNFISDARLLEIYKKVVEKKQKHNVPYLKRRIERMILAKDYHSAGKMRLTNVK